MSLPKTMKAAVIKQPGKIEIEQVPVPRAAAGEVLLKIEACALCGTDQRVLSGEKREADAILRTLQNRLDETAAAATFATSYEDGAYLILASSRRADAVVLESLIAAAPKSDLVAKLVRGLLAHRVKGRWGNTQENTFVLLALDAYFQAFEKVTPNFVANIWLGEGLASAWRLP